MPLQLQESGPEAPSRALAAGGSSLPSTPAVSVFLRLRTHYLAYKVDPAWDQEALVRAARHVFPAIAQDTKVCAHVGAFWCGPCVHVHAWPWYSVEQCGSVGVRVRVRLCV